MRGKKGPIHVHVGAKGAVGYPYPKLWITDKSGRRKKGHRHLRKKQKRILSLKELRRIAHERTNREITSELRRIEEARLE